MKHIEGIGLKFNITFTSLNIYLDLYFHFNYIKFIRMLF